jgi:adenylate cyclase
MDPTRGTTVLFADVVGSTRLYETVGDKLAAEAIGRCIGKLREATEQTEGRLVKTMGDSVMALFPNPDAAAMAATRMHLAVESLPALGDNPFGVRIGFHSGAVIQRDNDVFGDTVNLAFRIVEQARKGQVLTSEETAALLMPVVRGMMRRLYPIQVKGKTGDVGLCEFVWRQSPDVTDLSSTMSSLKTMRVKLRLKYRDRDVLRRRGGETIVVGRDPECQIVVADQKASRQHCTIERRHDRFVLKDHSTNGTYVTVEGEPEIVLQREEFTLRKRGWVAFGQPRTDSTDTMEYLCEGT